jgi:hypothetical protein
MATLVQLDRRYRTEKEAIAFIPYLPCAQWRVVKEGSWLHLQFVTDRPGASILKAFAKLHPAHTYRVLESDDAPAPSGHSPHDWQEIDPADNVHNAAFLEDRAKGRRP